MFSKEYCSIHSLEVSYFTPRKWLFKLHVFKQILDKTKGTAAKKRGVGKVKRKRSHILLERHEEIDFFQAVAPVIGNNPIRLALKAAPNYPSGAEKKTLSHHKNTKLWVSLPTCVVF
jgi:hypothetical protein